MRDLTVAMKNASKFYTDDEDPEIIKKAGIELFKDLYLKSYDGSLNELRH